MVNRSESLAEFAWETSQTPDISTTIGRIVAYTQRLLGADHAGITLLRGRGRLASVGQTSAVVAEADHLQHQLREGPCVDAAVEVEDFVAGDLGQDERWPNWGPRAAALGLHSIVSASLHGQERRLGALNIYGAERNRFSDEDLETAQLFAAHASAALAAAMAQADLKTAVKTRTEIGQAQGILMERYQIDADRAITILKRYSQDTNTKLYDVAVHLIEKGSLPDLGATDGQVSAVPQGADPAGTGSTAASAAASGADGKVADGEGAGIGAGSLKLPKSNGSGSGAHPGRSVGRSGLPTSDPQDNRSSEPEPLS